jgi:hypothetical protein
MAKWKDIHFYNNYHIIFIFNSKFTIPNYPERIKSLTFSKGMDLRMKQQRFFPGIILMGFGAYFYLQKSNILLFDGFFTWPTILLIVGLAFLFQAYGGQDYQFILPGVILTGFGIHFHLVRQFPNWPDQIGIFVLIIAIGFFLQSQKTKEGFLYSMLFFILALLSLFYQNVIAWLGLLRSGQEDLWHFWPILLILVGAYLLFVKRK